jgi:hypothetical protein
MCFLNNELKICQTISTCSVKFHLEYRELKTISCIVKTISCIVKTSYSILIEVMIPHQARHRGVGQQGELMVPPKKTWRWTRAVEYPTTQNGRNDSKL